MCKSIKSHVIHCTWKHVHRRTTVHAHTLTKPRTGLVIIFGRKKQTSKQNKNSNQGQFIPCNYYECECRTRWFYDPLEPGIFYKVYLSFNRTFLQFVCLTVNIISLLFKCIEIIVMLNNMISYATTSRKRFKQFCFTIQTIMH